ncbi:MAG: hypothetical protein MK135_09890 [Polyangiaceae bacterium]|nr:hypothetical protein [Polyangiaceae bacterium]
MKAKAPGKLVLSGAYSVLRGAPAIVTAVDRFVTADSDRPATFFAPEVTAALEYLKETPPAFPGSTQVAWQAPWYDAGPLRDGDPSTGRKLGLGSSAAIVAASLGATLGAHFEPAIPTSKLRDLIHPIARVAHRQAQGGGSGIDVAAAVYGGTLAAQILPSEEGNQLKTQTLALPENLVFEVWAMPSSASTKDFVRAVFELEKTSPLSFRKYFEAQAEASEKAAKAILPMENQQEPDAQSARLFIQSLQEQLHALTHLGAAAGVPIVLDDVLEMNAELPSDACFLPSGAGGGDITIYLGPEATDSQFREKATSKNLQLIPLQLNAAGLQLEP